mgnify:CR=1 FL=1
MKTFFNSCKCSPSVWFLDKWNILVNLSNYYVNPKELSSFISSSMKPLFLSILSSPLILLALFPFPSSLFCFSNNSFAFFSLPRFLLIYAERRYMVCENPPKAWSFCNSISKNSSSSKSCRMMDEKCAKYWNADRFKIADFRSQPSRGACRNFLRTAWPQRNRKMSAAGKETIPNQDESDS